MCYKVIPVSYPGWMDHCHFFFWLPSLGWYRLVPQMRRITEGHGVVTHSLSLSQTIAKTKGVSVLHGHVSACWAGHLKNMLGLGHPQLILPRCTIWDVRREADPWKQLLLAQGSQRDTVPSWGSLHAR